MKKIITILLCAVLGLMMLTGCGGYNKQLVDLTYRYDYAIIERYDGEEIVKISSWTDYADGDQLQIKDTDGNVYLVHSSKVILVKEP